MRSRSRWYSLRLRGDGSRWRRPRESSGRAAYGTRSRSGMLPRRVEQFRQRSAWHVCRHKRVTDAFQQNESNASGVDLLVMSHQLQIALQTKGGSLHRQTGCPEKGIHAAHVAIADKSEFLRKPCGKEHTGANRLAMQPGAVAGAGFNGVAKGVTEIQQG